MYWTITKQNKDNSDQRTSWPFRH